MNAWCCHLVLSGLLLAADHLPAQERGTAAERAAIGNVAAERWLAALAGRWAWSDGARTGTLELSLAAGGLGLVGSGSGFSSGGVSNWLILWNAASRQLVMVVISSTGEHYHLKHNVSGTELKGNFLGVSESADGHRPVRGECIWQFTSADVFSLVWKPWFIADQGQPDRQFDFRRRK